MTVGAEDSCHEVLGRYEPTSDPDPAELAFVIEGRGKGTGHQIFTALLAESRETRDAITSLVFSPP